MMGGKESSGKRRESRERKFRLVIAVICKDGRWNPRLSKPLLSALRSLRSFAAIHFERAARQPPSPGYCEPQWRLRFVVAPCRKPPEELSGLSTRGAQRDSRRYQISRLLAIGY